MLLRCERNRDAESRRLSGLEVVGYRYGPWREYRGEEGEYLCTDRRWERIGGVRKLTDVPLQTTDLSGRSKEISGMPQNVSEFCVGAVTLQV
jgi:hypothetical protein